MSVTDPPEQAAAGAQGGGPGTDGLARRTLGEDGTRRRRTAEARAAEARAAGSGAARRPARRARSRAIPALDGWRRWAFVAVEAVLVVATAALGWVGLRTVLDTTAGQAVDPVLDPDEPGYEAFVSPTPVALLAGLDHEGALAWVAVAALGGPEERGGSLLFVPQATLAHVDALGEVTTLGAAYAAEGRPALHQATADLLGIGFEEVVLVEPARMAELLAPVAPLPVTLPDDVGDIEAGEHALGPEELVELLVTRPEGESDLTRLARHELVWRAWLDAVAASTDADVVPGERSAGIGRFVRALAAGETVIEVLPVRRGELPDTGAELFTPEEDEVAAVVHDLVPFPAGARPGDRPRLRVLDAVGADGLAARVARDAVRAGVQVVVVGNADRFGQDESRVVYFEPVFDDEAMAVANALGIGADRVERQDGPNPNDLVDITVVVGNDVATAYGARPRPGGEDPG